MFAQFLAGGKAKQNTFNPIIAIKCTANNGVGWYIRQHAGQIVNVSKIKPAYWLGPCLCSI
jgi:hypothetical protein